jgi:hypothetical protein
MKTMKNKKNVSTSNAFVNAMRVDSNFTTTEKGAKTNKSTLNDVLDWFGAGGALRQRDEASIINLFSKAFAQDRLLAMKVLCYFRDIREGQGERRTFRIIIKWLAEHYPDVIRKNLENIPFYGRYDDLFILFDTPVENDMINYISLQLKQDLRTIKENSHKSENI